MKVDLDRYMEWACGLKFADLPDTVVLAAKCQIASTLSALLAGIQSEEGQHLARAHGFMPLHEGAGTFDLSRQPPAHIVFLLASWSMIHDYDDVMLGGHTGHSSVLVPMLLAWLHGGSGEQLILAQVTANEIGARMNLSHALGDTRGQMASSLHLITATVARCKFEQDAPEHYGRALAFALANTGRLSIPAFLGGDAKFFCAASPIRTAWESVDHARAGLRAARESLDGSEGYFDDEAAHICNAFGQGLGREWFTLTNSFKQYPVCGYICSAIDCLRDLLHTHELDAEQVEEVVLDANIFTCMVERYAHGYLRGPGTPVAALTFSPRWVLASTLAHGDFSLRNLAPRVRDDQRVWDLMRRIQIRYSRRHSHDALLDGIPTGQALASARPGEAIRFIRFFLRRAMGRGGRLHDWIRDADFIVQWARRRRRARPAVEELTKPLGCALHVRTADGRELSASQHIPVGFAGNGDWADKLALMKAKYLECAAPVFDAPLCQRHWETISSLEEARGNELGLLNPLRQLGVCH